MWILGLCLNNGKEQEGVLWNKVDQEESWVDWSYLIWSLSPTAYSIPVGRRTALTVCMENPEILGRSQIERFIPVEIFREKSNTFRGITFSVFAETTEVFCTICLDYYWQASCREKAKNLPVFYRWYNSILFLFSEPKKYQYHLTEIFHRNFRTYGKRT